MNFDQLDQDYNNHRLSKLIELCKDHNSNHHESIIDLEKYATAEELIFCLWERKVDVNVLGFGYPHDESLMTWVPQEDEEGENLVYGLESNPVYQSYVHSDKLIEFLYYSLLLPKKYHGSYHPLDFIDYSRAKEILKGNLDSFNGFWMKMGREPITDYSEFRAILKSNTLSKIELCYLLWESEDYGITNTGLNVWDFIDRINDI